MRYIVFGKIISDAFEDAARLITEDLKNDPRDLDALFLSGMLYLKGVKGFKKDPQKAVELLEDLSQKGYECAPLSLAYLYAKGIGTPTSYLKAALQLEKISAYEALEGNNLHAAAKKFSQAYQRAFEWAKQSDKEQHTAQLLQQAVEQKEVGAALCLSQRYLEGNGVPVDRYQAAALAKLAVPCPEMTYKQLFTLFCQVAQEGDQRAYYPLAQLFAEGLGTEQNLQQAVHYYQLAAELDSAPAHYALAQLYLTEQLGPSDPASAAEHFQKAVTLEPQQALPYYHLGRLNEKGVGIKQDVEQAATLYQQAEDLGCAEAAYARGCLYLTEQLGQPDYPLAVARFEKTIDLDQKHALAHYQLACRYERGEGVPSSESQAADYCRKAAALGCIEAPYGLARFYAAGKLGDKNHKKAAKLYKISADLGYVPAKKELGLLYNDGIGVPKSRRVAEKYLKQAACQNDTSAQAHLALLIQESPLGSCNNPQVKQLYQQAAQGGSLEGQAGLAMTAAANGDWTQAMQSFEALAERGEPNSQLAVTALYMTGKAGEQKIDEGINRLRQLADQQQLAAAQFYCGQFHEKGSYKFSQNEQRATDYYQLAAGQNNPKALYALGRIKETNKDFREAVDYYQQAAKLDHLEAKYKIALFLIMGKETSLNIEEGVKLLEQLSQKEHLEAMHSLGYLYVFGLDGLFKKDLVKGKLLLETAAKKGFAPAAYRLAKLEALELAERIKTSIVNAKISGPARQLAEQIKLKEHCQKICDAINTNPMVHARDAQKLLETVTTSSSKIEVLTNLWKQKKSPKYQALLNHLGSVQQQLAKLKTMLPQQTAVSDNTEALTATRNSGMPSQHSANATFVAHSIAALSLVERETGATLPAERGGNTASYPLSESNQSSHDKKLS